MCSRGFRRKKNIYLKKKKNPLREHFSENNKKAFRIQEHNFCIEIYIGGEGEKKKKIPFGFENRYEEIGLCGFRRFMMYF